jgi:hypothetical protein
MLIRRRRLRVEIEQLHVQFVPVRAPRPSETVTTPDPEIAPPAPAQMSAKAVLPAPNPSLLQEDTI